MPTAENPVAVDAALNALNRRKWVALAVFCVILAAGLTMAASLPNLYRATASVLVERQQVSEAYVTQAVTSELETRIQTIQQEVMSRARLSDVISRFNLYPDLRRRGTTDAAVERMRLDVQLELKGVEQAASGRNATIAFAISYRGRDPSTVASVANAVARLYIDRNTRLREGQAVETADFLQRQLADAKKELDSQEDRKREYELGHLGELPQQVDVNLASLERLNTQLRLNGENQIRAMDRRDRLEKQLADLDAVPAATPAQPSAPEDQRAKLEQRLAELLTKFADEYPEVIRVRGELAALDQPPAAAHAADAKPRPPDARQRLKAQIADADVELKTLKDQESTLKVAIAAYEQRVENAPKRQEEFQTLSRDFTTTKERYETLLKRFEEAQLARSLEEGRKVEQFRMLDAAVPPRVPAAPDRARLAFLAFVLAVAAAVGAIVLLERLNRTFHAVDDLRPLVAGRIIAVPAIATAASARAQRRRFALGALAFALMLALAVAGARVISRGNEPLVRFADRGHM